jgi:hypothetical protein
MKYGTIPERVYRRTQTVKFDLAEIRSHLTFAGWLKVSPEKLYDETAEALVRMDIEPKFFTFHSFADMGQETLKKFTESDFTHALDLNEKGEHDYAKARKRELGNNEVLQFIFDLVLDGKDKNDIKNETLDKFTSL